MSMKVYDLSGILNLKSRMPNDDEKTEWSDVAAEETSAKDLSDVQAQISEMIIGALESALDAMDLKPLAPGEVCPNCGEVHYTEEDVLREQQEQEWLMEDYTAEPETSYVDNFLSNFSRRVNVPLPAQYAPATTKETAAVADETPQEITDEMKLIKAKMLKSQVTCPISSSLPLNGSKNLDLNVDAHLQD